MNLIFIHGAGSSADFWHQQRAAFPDAHYLELHTLYSIPHTSHSRIEEYATAVADYVEREKLETVILNGHSMGGAVALTLALSRPAWLRGLILTGTGSRLKVSPLLLELLRTDYAAAVDRIIEWSFASAQEGGMTYRQRIIRNGTRRKMLRVPQRVTLADYEACDRFDVTARLADIEVPTLIAVGGQDRMTRPELSEELHAAIPGSTLRKVVGAGHMLPLEKPDEYNSVVREFIAGVVSSRLKAQGSNGEPALNLEP